MVICSRSRLMPFKYTSCRGRVVCVTPKFLDAAGELVKAQKVGGMPVCVDACRVIGVNAGPLRCRTIPGESTPARSGGSCSRQWNREVGLSVML
jgi:hypothetical protein